MGGKKVNGRTRQFWVATNGFLLRVLVHPANISDTAGAAWLLRAHHAAFPRMCAVRADGGDTSGLADWMAAHTMMTRNVIEKPVGQKGFAVIPKRWVAERSIAWSGRSRLSARAYNRNCDVREACISLGSIALLLNRVYPRE